MKLGWKKGQKGLTLVELMVVMAVLAVLAAIIFPAVSGTSGAAADNQVKQDAGLVNSAVGDYYGDQTGAAVLTTSTKDILGVTGNKQEKNSLFPEDYVTAVYTSEVPEAAASADGDVSELDIKDTDGTTTITAKELVEKRNAITLDTLVTDKYIVEPASYNDLTNGFHTYLWLVAKTTALVDSGTEVDSRQVQVFKLVKAVQDETTKYYKLYYVRIY